MKIQPNNNLPIPSKPQPTAAEIKEMKSILATGVGLSVQDQKVVNNILKGNNPSDPLVAKKILDSLDLGFINFNQRERDAIAAILGAKAEAAQATVRNER